ncbi:MAG: sel1 repeat family protein, partial [Thiomonas sp.]
MSTPRSAELDLGIHTQPPQHLDFSETQHPLEVLAHVGDAAAQEWLGAHNHDRKDFVQAAHWYRKAAEQGSA